MQQPWRDCHGASCAPKLLPEATEASDFQALAAGSMRFSQRFVGHCNVHTDIKEAVFVGDDDAVLACGSDQGHVLLFDSWSGRLLRVLWADTEVANCVQCHPTLPVLATSGLEDVVRPLPCAVSLARSLTTLCVPLSSLSTAPVRMIRDSDVAALCPKQAAPLVCRLECSP